MHTFGNIIPLPFLCAVMRRTSISSSSAIDVAPRGLLYLYGIHLRAHNHKSLHISIKSLQFIHVEEKKNPKVKLSNSIKLFIKYLSSQTLEPNSSSEIINRTKPELEQPNFWTSRARACQYSTRVRLVCIVPRERVRERDIYPTTWRWPRKLKRCICLPVRANMFFNSIWFSSSSEKDVKTTQKTININKLETSDDYIFT